MTDYFTQLEAELRRAAALEGRPGRFGLARGLRRRHALIGVAAALVVSAPVLAKVAGVWTPALSGAPHFAPPTLSSQPPDRRLLAILGVLRRPQRPIDRTYAAVQALRFLAIDGVSTDYIRYVGRSPAGHPLYLVPYRSQTRQMQLPPMLAKLKFADSDPRLPGVCLAPAPDPTFAPDVNACVNIAAIQNGTDDLAVVGIRSHPAHGLVAPNGRPRPGPPPSDDAVTRFLGYGLVPDGVAHIVVKFTTGARQSVAVHNNVFIYELRSGDPIAITWLDAAGRPLNTFPPFPRR